MIRITVIYAADATCLQQDVDQFVTNHIERKVGRSFQDIKLVAQPDGYTAMVIWNDANTKA